MRISSAFLDRVTQSPGKTPKSYVVEERERLFRLRATSSGYIHLLLHLSPSQLCFDDSGIQKKPILTPTSFYSFLPLPFKFPHSKPFLLIFVTTLLSFSSFLSFSLPLFSFDICTRLVKLFFFFVFFSLSHFSNSFVFFLSFFLSSGILKLSSFLSICRPFFLFFDIYTGLLKFILLISKAFFLSFFYIFPLFSLLCLFVCLFLFA
ncbi:unnamed protein product [Acanthosepion pharaonis]|uniref:Uncharacterized protein n=1 Tax=Acanthosepion pharaonis TaxID=158019 RepID=A0A812BW26_ACAPH|nr:unnamed protein product [Sepia pharaonis]